MRLVRARPQKGWQPCTSTYTHQPSLRKHARRLLSKSSIHLRTTPSAVGNAAARLSRAPKLLAHRVMVASPAARCTSRRRRRVDDKISTPKSKNERAHLINLVPHQSRRENSVPRGYVGRTPPTHPPPPTLREGAGKKWQHFYRIFK